MSITALPTPPQRSQAPATFITNADNFMAALPTFVIEANTTAAQMTAAATGGAYTIGYTFSTTTTDSDPGAGVLRLSSATQNTSTTIRVDLLDVAATDWTNVLDTFDDSTSTIKGFIRLAKVSDGSKWLLFSLSALASPSGYRNITVSNIGGSSASPFSNGDVLTLSFSRNGDKGDIGATASSAMTWLSRVTASSSATCDVDTTFDSTYDSYVIIATNVIPNSGNALYARFKLAGSYVTTSTYFNHTLDCSSASASYASSVGAGAAFINLAVGTGTSAVVNFTMSIPAPTSAVRKAVYWNGSIVNTSDVGKTASGQGSNSGTGALTGIRFYSSVGNVDSGTFDLYGIKHS